MKLCRTRLKSEVIYSGKDLIRFQKTHDKKEGGGQTKNILYGLGSLKIMIGYQKDVL